jgi:hypothetical protein
MSPKVLAKRITVHLRRLEKSHEQLHFRDPSAYAIHQGIRINYNNLTLRVTKTDAEIYLIKLDAGFVGTHADLHTQ